jgi:hypothetical protein
MSPKKIARRVLGNTCRSTGVRASCEGAKPFVVKMLMLLWLLLLLISCLSYNDGYLVPGNSPVIYGGILSAPWTPLLANSSDGQETIKVTLVRGCGKCFDWPVFL